MDYCDEINDIIICVLNDVADKIKGWNYCDFFDDLINEETETNLDECFAYEI